MLQVFFMNHLHPSHSNFFENSRRYSQVKVHHRCQRHQWQICHRYQRHRWQHFATSSPCVVDTGGKFATGVNETGGKKFAAGVKAAGGKLPPVSMTPVSLTPVANNGNNIRLQIPESELEGKNLYICFLYYREVTKQNY